MLCSLALINIKSLKNKKLCGFHLSKIFLVNIRAFRFTKRRICFYSEIPPLKKFVLLVINFDQGMQDFFFN